MINDNIGTFHRRGRDVIERYCSHVGDNVIMVRSHGPDDKYTCLSSEICNCTGSSNCGRASVNTPNCAYMPHGTGVYKPRDDGPIE
ncbi:MAG: hypothetical protein PUB34_03950 [Clostridia bacterium]|nr:hypothetical protein [Clostridia bacterium]